MGTFSFNTQTGIAFFFDSLKGVSCRAPFLAHDVELILQARALLLELVQVTLGLCARCLEISQSIFEGRGKLLLSKQVLLDSTDTSFLIFDQLSVRDVLALVARGRR